MAKTLGQLTSFFGGIADSKKAGQEYSFAFERSIDFRSDPKSFKLLPKSEKDSGSIVTGLPMWGARACSRIFSYDNAGSIYLNDGSWSKVHTAASSSGNGLAYYSEDLNLYYAQDTTIGRLENACTDNNFVDDFLSAEGGDPTNTKSIDFELGSSQYASRADTASTSITGDLTLEAYVNPESLPTTGNTMTLISKWDEDDKKSYKMDIGTVSNFFGDGSDGALTISSNTTESPIDANCTGTSGNNYITVSNVTGTFLAGQKIMIHQTRGTGAGAAQYNQIQSVDGTTIYLEDVLTFSPAHSATSSVANKAQVRVLKEYTNVTINAGITYTCKAWDGLKGGIIGWYANGTVTIAGIVNGVGKGFVGGLTGYLNPTLGPHSGASGESYDGPSVAGTYISTSPPPSPVNPPHGGSGGGGTGSRGGDLSGGGGGASYGGSGSAGESVTAYSPYPTGGATGSTYGSSDLSVIHLGSGGGGGGKAKDAPTPTDGKKGGNGGAIACIFGKTITVTGSVSLNGGKGDDGGSGDRAGAGGGSGGSALFKGQVITLGSGLVTCSGGARGDSADGNWFDKNGGPGGNGRIHAIHYTSTTGTTSPTITTVQDDTLGDVDGYSLRLLVSDDGATSETYQQNLDISTGVWSRLQVAWDASASTAYFYQNGVSIGTDTGAMTAIHDNASVFAIAADIAADTSPQNFYDGLMDDVRVWNDIRTESELINKNDAVLAGNEVGLVAYYEFTSDVSDSQSSGNNDLTAQNAPTYSDSVPFNGLTTRNDDDQSDGNVAHAANLTLATSISETDTNKAFFIPDYDPQKSITLSIDTVGTGNWTVVVHDAQNREIATVTVTNAELTTGFYEFIWDESWRPHVGATYHFHVTSTVADGVIDIATGETTMGDADGNPFAYFTTHYQFLVSDEYHPMLPIVNILAIGNERYLATYSASAGYDPMRLTLPAGERIRCLAYWREYLVMGTWSGTSITDFENGKLFFWDGISDTYNHWINVPEGGINSMFGTRDILFLLAGYSGTLLTYSGGGTAEEIKTIPNLEDDEYVEIAPGSMTMWKSMLSFGVNLNTDSSEVHQGIYTYGSKNKDYPESLGFSFPLSLGDQTSTGVKIGMVYPSGQNLYVGWQNVNAYGIDKISYSNDVVSSGTIEFLISDFGSISQDTFPLTYRADFESLADGDSVVLKYKGDREATWQTLETEDTANATEVRAIINERNKEAQFAIDVSTTNSTSPIITGITIESENADTERPA